MSREEKGGGGGGVGKRKGEGRRGCRRGVEGRRKREDG